jgi:hypothetical protein
LKTPGLNSKLGKIDGTGVNGETSEWRPGCNVVLSHGVITHHKAPLALEVPMVSQFQPSRWPLNGRCDSDSALYVNTNTLFRRIDIDALCPHTIKNFTKEEK